MRRPKELKPCPPDQLCAIARSLIRDRPTMDDAEWAEAIKLRLARLEFANVRNPEQLTTAMRSVQVSLERQSGQSRPVPPPPMLTPLPSNLTQQDPPWKNHPRRSGFQSLREIAASLGHSPSSAESSDVPAVPRSDEQRFRDQVQEFKATEAARERELQARRRPRRSRERCTHEAQDR